MNTELQRGIQVISIAILLTVLILIAGSESGKLNREEELSTNILVTTTNLDHSATEGKSLQDGAAKSVNAWIELASDVSEDEEQMLLSGNVTEEIPQGDGTDAQADSAWGNVVEKFGNIAATDVRGYVNVRQQPNTEASIVGKAYDGAVVTVCEDSKEGDEWYHIQSGTVDGYVKSEYFITGDALADCLDEYIFTYATVTTEKLNVRKEPTTDSKKIGSVASTNRYEVMDTCDDFLEIVYNGEKTGWISSEYTELKEDYMTAISIDEEEAAREAEREKQRQEEQERAKKAAQEGNIETAVAGETSAESPAVPAVSSGDIATLRQNIVDYAMQYLGNRYISGGQSLESGTDCSGFTCYVYAAFGYAIDRTPSGQYKNAGRSITYAEVQPGDIICYGSGRVTHVGIYIGDGCIIHSANSRKGVVIYEAGYDTIVGVKNVLD